MRCRTVISTLSLLAVTALSGCGSDSEGSASILSKDDLDSALITLDDLGEDFQVDKEETDEEDADLGCLNGLEDLDDTTDEPQREDEIAFEAEGDLGLPGIFNTIGSFKSEKEAASVLTRFAEAVEDCKSVDVTDDDGLRIQLEVSSDDALVDPGATDQVNLQASGTASTGAVEFPFSLRFSAIQIDNQIALVGYVNGSESPGKDAAAVEQRAFDRFAPVVTGEKAPDLEPLNLTIVDLEDLIGGNPSGDSSGTA